MSSQDLYDDAIATFQRKFEHVQRLDIKEPSAMTLATADGAGRPTARMVLLRGVDYRGFVFYTNSNSRKAQQMAANSHVALCFHWGPIEEQVRIEGSVTQVDHEESDAYWERRPRGSQIGAWASDQSELLAERGDLERRISEFEAKFGDAHIPRPPHWYGYRVVPNRIEFWEGRDARLHERTVYELENGEWKQFMLYP